MRPYERTVVTSCMQFTKTLSAVRDGYWLLHGVYLQMWGPYMCFIMCYRPETQTLAKCTHIYSKNVISNWYNIKTPQTPAAHVLTQRQMPTFSLSHTHLHVWCVYIAVGIKSALTSNVSVVHTVGPNSDTIYKPSTTFKPLASRFPTDNMRQT